VALIGRALTLHSATVGPHRFTLVGPGVCLRVEKRQAAMRSAGPSGALDETRSDVTWRPSGLERLPWPPRTRTLLQPQRSPGDDLSARTLRCAGNRLAALLDALEADALEADALEADAREADALEADARKTDAAPAGAPAPAPAPAFAFAPAPVPEPEPDRLARCARALVGLGPGSTPTGDDLLVGALAGAWHLAALDRRSVRLRDRLCEIVASLDRGATTPTAWEMLQEATRGAFPEPLLRLARGLGDPAESDESLAAATRALAAMGGHSGADLAAGLVGLVGLARRLAAVPRLDGKTPRDAQCETTEGESE